MVAGVIILGENIRQGRELLNIGRELSAALEKPLYAFVYGDEENAREYIACGADEVVLLPFLPEGRILEDYIPVIAEQAGCLDPDIFLLAATLQGKGLAAGIAERLKTGLCTECINIELDKITSTLKMERLMFGGAAVQAVKCTARPQMATIPPGRFEPAQPHEGRTGVIKQVELPPDSGVRLISRKAGTRDSVDIARARVIVCAGRGIQKQEDMALLHELAEVLGAQVAGTRPVVEELHWLPEDRCIGLSGKQVKPELYIGIGVSGQIQHICGIRDSRIIAAVNCDEQAPIFQAADFGITGDLYEVVPGLIQELKKVLSR